MDVNMKDNETKQVEEEGLEEVKLTKLSASLSVTTPITEANITGFGGIMGSVDRMSYDNRDNYKEMVKVCRFFYKHDPIASTVINKLIDIGVSKLVFYQGDLNANEFKMFKGIESRIQTFLEDISMEYLLSGLVIPEVTYDNADKKELRRYGVKRYESLVVPTDMWVRNAETIKINRTFVSSKASYSVEVPEALVYFIQTKGKYEDGTEDKELYAQLVKEFGSFVEKVAKGETYILLEDPYVIERKRMTSQLYPIPYMSAALEPLKHKRNLRKMDYSIASRVISAILLVRLGDKDFPLVEGDEKQLAALRSEMTWRSNSRVDQERIFQLFGNHTLQLDWVYPPVDALLDDAKYADINQDILFALGFPRILLTGEAERTGTSDPEYALLSPLKTMEALRNKLLDFVYTVVEEVCDRNKISRRPIFRFAPINLHDFGKLFEMLTKLYESGNLSRETYTDYMGYDLDTELERRKTEKSKLKKMGLDEFSPLPHSNSPSTPGATPKPEATTPVKPKSNQEKVSK